MSKRVQVLLLEDVKGLGEAGQIVEVAEGYARNALFPGGLAALADENVQSRAAAKNEKLASKEAKRVEELQAVAEKYDGTELVIETKVNESKGIYGSVTAAQVAKELSNQAGISVKVAQISADEFPIKEVGHYSVEVRLADDVTFSFDLVVEPDEASKKTDDDD